MLVKNHINYYNWNLQTVNCLVQLHIYQAVHVGKIHWLQLKVNEISALRGLTSGSTMGWPEKACLFLCAGLKRSSVGFGGTCFGALTTSREMRSLTLTGGIAIVIRLVTRSGGHDRSGPHEGRPVFSRVLAIAGMHFPAPSAISVARVAWSPHTELLCAPPDAGCSQQQQQLRPLKRFRRNVTTKSNIPGSKFIWYVSTTHV